MPEPRLRRRNGRGLCLRERRRHRSRHGERQPRERHQLGGDADQLRAVARGCHAGVVSDVAGHNSAYRREAVVSLGDELSDVMQSLTAVQQELRARGSVVYLEPSARVRMLNISRPGWYLVDQFGKGRQFATHRCRRWPR